MVDLAPSYILNVGLPYASSELAIILDAEPTDVPERYREPERARSLVAVLADAVTPRGIVVAPAREWEVQDRARDAGCRVAVFSTGDDVTPRDAHVAELIACVRDGRITLESAWLSEDGGALLAGTPPVVQLAAAAAMRALSAANGKRRSPGLPSGDAAPRPAPAREEA